MSEVEQTATFLLVIPAYEEQVRLPPFLRELVGQLAQASFVTHIQIVDDGSSVESLHELGRAIGQIADLPAVRILPIIRLGRRRGKGCAIRTGWDRVKKTGWLAFVDADGAISAGEVCRLFNHVMRQSLASGCVAMRKMKPDGDGGRRSRRSWHRGWSGRFFTRFVNLLFRSSFQDPQCGFKIISTGAWQKVRSRSREDGFCFDLELMLLLQDERLTVEEMAIDWQEKSGGHFHLLPDGIVTLLAAVRMRLGRKSQSPLPG